MWRLTDQDDALETPAALELRRAHLVEEDDRGGIQAQLCKEPGDLSAGAVGKRP